MISKGPPEPPTRWSRTRRASTTGDGWANSCRGCLVGGGSRGRIPWADHPTKRQPLTPKGSEPFPRPRACSSRKGLSRFLMDSPLQACYRSAPGSLQAPAPSRTEAFRIVSCCGDWAGALSGHGRAGWPGKSGKPGVGIPERACFGWMPAARRDQYGRSLYHDGQTSSDPPAESAPPDCRLPQPTAPEEVVPMGFTFRPGILKHWQ